MKVYTDIEQSKKLAENLPIGSADMWYCPYPNDADWYDEPNIGKAELLLNQLPCWSLAALLDVMPNNEHITTTIARGGWKVDTMEYCDKWWCEYEDDDNINNFSISADNPIDACYEMILKLHEQKLL